MLCVVLNTEKEYLILVLNTEKEYLKLVKELTLILALTVTLILTVSTSANEKTENPQTQLYDETTVMPAQTKEPSSIFFSATATAVAVHFLGLTVDTQIRKKKNCRLHSTSSLHFHCWHECRGTSGELLRFIFVSAKCAQKRDILTERPYFPSESGGLMLTPKPNPQTLLLQLRLSAPYPLRN